MIVEQIPIEKLETLNFLLKCLEDFELESPCDIKAQSEFFLKKLHLELRNDFIIENLVQILSIDQNKPVVCILGASHIEGVKQDLENRGFVVLGKNEFLKKFSKIEL